MSVSKFYHDIINARRGKISLLISVGGLCVTITVASFAVSFNNKLDEVEKQTVYVGNKLKEIRDLSSSILVDYRSIDSKEVSVADITANRQGKRLSGDTLRKEGDSTNLIDTETGSTNNVLLDTNSVKVEDTIRIIIPNVTLTNLRKSGFIYGKLSTGESVSVVSTNVDLEQMFDALTKYNAKLEDQNQNLRRELSVALKRSKN